MIIDARSLPAGKVIETDVCVVGAGTAGITLAREFVGKKFRVCLLESGGLEPEPETQALAEGENVGREYFPLGTARARCFGGTATRWDIPIDGVHLGARLRPLDAIDFEKRDWVPHSGWPFGKTHLDPYYARAQSFCHVEPATFDTKDWERLGGMTGLPLNGAGVETVIFKFGSRDVFLQESRNEIMRAENITTYLHANVLEIETDETAQTVTGVRAVCLDGKQLRVKARFYVLATGGIAVPRLLLSSNKVQRAGLGNQNDLVGRFFMEHMHFWSSVFVPSTDVAQKSAAFYTQIHSVNAVPILAKLAVGESAQRREGLLNHCVQLIPRVMSKPYHYPDNGRQPITSKGIDSFKAITSAVRHGQVPDDCGGHLGNVARDMGDIAKVGFRKLLRSLSGKRMVFILAHMTEQSPHPDSRVTLSEERDKLGMKRVQLDWRLSPLDIRSGERAQDVMDEELRRAGLGWVNVHHNGDLPPSDLHGGYHHMGSTRMHTDPKQGVVDETCRVHGVSNLFIAGPSVFPTGGYANPVLTIVALAIRLAEYVGGLLGKARSL